MKLRSFVAGMAVLATCVATHAANDPFAEGVRTTDPLTPEAQQKTFKLPPGFTVQLVAAEPELRKPMNMAFDGAGRLWITESREYPWPTNASPRDTIRIFSDFDANGRARKVTTFATNLNIPIGIYPFLSLTADKSKSTWKCVAWSIPNIWLFEDTDGDGTADKKEKLLGPFDHTRDTHGNQASFRRGLDGWIYATHGFNNRSRVAGRDGHEISMPSGNTYRFRMDGERIEHWTHGQVNPFGLTFDALGNLYSADCHSSPIYQLLRGGWYPSFGAPDDGLGFAPTAIQHTHGSTAICGITMLDDPSWPEELFGNLIIGNVMPSRINRDRVEWRGSTSVGHEMPDLVTVTDPWFRPVDLQLGPDGALWVADFYNRIIGHYEVPLTHPLRDRERGRIWRIVPPKGADLAQLSLPASVDELVKELGAPNRARRNLAQDRLTDRFGTEAKAALQRAVQQPLNAFQQMHAMYGLERLGQLRPNDIVNASHSADPMLRVHATRIAADILQRDNRPGPMVATDRIAAAVEIAVAGLKDKNPFVQRCAAEALANHNLAASSNVRYLLELRGQVPPEDTHLTYAVRRALCDQLQRTHVFEKVLADTWTEEQSRAIADVTPAVTNAAAASFLVAHLQKYSESRAVAAKYLKQAARFIPQNRIDDLATLATGKFRDDVDLQATLFRSVQEGLQQRGAALTQRMKDWGNSLAGDLLSSVQRAEIDWVYAPVDGTANGSNPWVVQRRKSADGREADFLCTLPSGEQTTGVLRSKNFTAPQKLTFWMAGHDGFPDKPLQKKNFVELKDAASSTVLMHASATRNDTAQRVTWDLGAHAGKQVFVELVDGDTASAYAWLAVGRFEPAVVSMPKTTPKLIDDRLQAAAQIALMTRASSLETPLANALKMPAGADARATVAGTLLALNEKTYLPICSAIVSDADAPVALRQKMAQTIGNSDSAAGREVLLNVLRGAPQRLQPKLALALASSKAGSEALLADVEAKKLSARVLQDRALKEKLVASKVKDADARVAKLTKGLTPLNEELQKQIDQRRAAFSPVSSSAARGPAVFTKVCAGCHQIDGQGAIVGPQLDGVGARGAERIIEDIVDPNRNVDHAFVTTSFVLTDGDVVSGLFRREEGETVVYAEATGKENTIPKKQIKERHQSELSLMPEGLAESLTPQEFNDLLAYLLSKTATKK
jgi:putative heme-binding domain-containing protein